MDLVMAGWFFIFWHPCDLSFWLRGPLIGVMYVRDCAGVIFVAPTSHTIHSATSHTIVCLPGPMQGSEAVQGFVTAWLSGPHAHCAVSFLVVTTAGVFFACTVPHSISPAAAFLPVCISEAWMNFRSCVQNLPTAPHVVYVLRAGQLLAFDYDAGCSPCICMQACSNPRAWGFLHPLLLVCYAAASH